MGWRRIDVIALHVALVLTIVGCTPESTQPSVDPDATTSSVAPAQPPGTGASTADTVATPETIAPDDEPSTTGSPTVQANAACESAESATVWTSDRSVEVPVVAELPDGTRLRAAVYPHPDYDATLWSQWGQGIVLDDGRVLSAIGDHSGADGNSFFYLYDPEEHTLTQIGDALSLVDHEPGDWGFGKIHAQMVNGPCDDVIVSTYWGTRSGLEFSEGYRGDVLVRIDPNGETLSVLGGVLLDEHGVASMAALSDGSMVFAEAADPKDGSVGAFVALSGFTGERLFVERAEELDGMRSMAVLPDGRVMVTWSGSGVAIFDPAERELSVSDQRLPGERLRAAERAGGRLVAVTQDPPVFFEIRESGTIDPIGEARGYTTSITSQDGRRFWYIPDAHGGAWEKGTPLIEFDSDSGDDRVVLELNPTVGSELGFRLGGTYNITSSHGGQELYIGLNGAPEAAQESFGEVVFVVVEFP